ncbi:hypothetical protein AtDm6_3510 [Acetobacter tropicalis]|uniref:Uncharacterized protein n=1 Tax=Acetobacter tropicalis TaxID=104102 RepID=A0A094ZDP6_9PROT|nr:hypothetical protein AtDm6_3510 [Acetobacter tropicalis]
MPPRRFLICKADPARERGQRQQGRAPFSSGMKKVRPVLP